MTFEEFFHKHKTKLERKLKAELKLPLLPPIPIQCVAIVLEAEAKKIISSYLKKSLPSKEWKIEINPNTSAYPDVKTEILKENKGKIGLDVKCFRVHQKGQKVTGSPAFDIGHVGEMLARWKKFKCHYEIVIAYQYPSPSNPKQAKIWDVFFEETCHIVGETIRNNIKMCNHQKNKWKIRPKSYNDMKNGINYWENDTILDGLNEVFKLAYNQDYSADFYNRKKKVGISLFER